jgi:phosphoribosyl-AMP cyclohydrolase
MSWAWRWRSSELEPLRIGPTGERWYDLNGKFVHSIFQDVTLVNDSREPSSLFSALRWNDEGLIPAIVQDAENGDVLMLAWMDERALRDTLATGQTHFYSRSRQTHWHKGETSGHVQHVESISLDCDGDVLLIKARQIGGACHEGYRSCFFRRVNDRHHIDFIDAPIFEPGVVYGSRQQAGFEGPSRGSGSGSSAN